LLGFVLVAGGLLVVATLATATIATIAAAMFFASALVIVGAFQIVHSVYTRSWSTFAVSLMLGFLYIGAGLVLMTDPLATSLVLTAAIAVLFLVSGITRLAVAFRQWGDFGWILAASGIMGVSFAGVIVVGFPSSALAAPGLLLGADLIAHGCWWIVVGLVVRHPATAPGRLAAT
jgi:uncharacterized membrane protein HdeD (DUF308 family)